MKSCRRARRPLCLRDDLTRGRADRHRRLQVGCVETGSKSFCNSFMVKVGEKSRLTNAGDLYCVNVDPITESLRRPGSRSD